MRLLFIIGAALLLAAVACFPSHPQSTFDAAGPVAKSQLNLFYVIFWVAVFVFVVVQGILLYAVIRFRRKPGQNEMPKQTHGNTRLEIAWTIAPAIVLAVVAVPTVITIFDNARTPVPEDAVHVKVTGHQWWWEFEYFIPEEIARQEADLDRASRGEIENAEVYKPTPYVVTANELNVPVGVPVSVVLESKDVIHSFWIPKLAGKVDMVPNNRNTMWFQADRVDADPDTPEIDPYLGQCAEFCGVAHSFMKFRVFVHEQDDFDTWVLDQQAPAIAPSTDLAAEGRSVFVDQRCWACHTLTDDDEPILRAARSTIGPNLTHVASRSTIGAGILANTPETLRLWLEDPGDKKTGNIMARDAPMYQPGSEWMTDGAKRDRDIEALVAY
ncbi:MAG: cytochrome c oxidase subunit II, partial [Chloroflexi bacterium]|nr:cytochrome c oxidase subunit II [Chloroflexota bacterium]